MRFGCTVLAIATLFLTIDTFAQDAKQDKGKKRAATKVELTDVPAAVTETAKKESPKASWTSAEKLSAKKQGTLYVLRGKDGEFSITVMATASGELQKLSKGRERKRKSK